MLIEMLLNELWSPALWALIRNLLESLDTEMIPDEAVEAAYNAHGSGAYVNKDDVRKMLESAAPHLMAGVWDEAIEAHKAWTWDDESMEPLTNPYRTKERGTE